MVTMGETRTQLGVQLAVPILELRHVVVELLSGRSAENDARLQEQLDGVVDAKLGDAGPRPAEPFGMLAEFSAERLGGLQVANRQRPKPFRRRPIPKPGRLHADAGPVDDHPGGHALGAARDATRQIDLVLGDEVRPTAR
jgi:hypothetical protein